MKTGMRARLTFAGSSVVVFAALLLLWQGIVWVLKLGPYLLPTPWEVARTIGERLPDLWSAVVISGEAAGGGLAASVLVGLAVALVFARSSWLRRLFYPYTILLQTVPIVAIAPLLITWVGPGLLAVTVVTFIICLAPIIANATQGLISVDENLVQLFLMHNATQGQILRKLRLPNALPYLFVGLRISSGIAVIGAITGELFAGSGVVGHGGLGYSIIYAQTQVQTAYLFALVMASAVMGFAFFFVVMFFEWWMLHTWHESAGGRD